MKKATFGLPDNFPMDIVEEEIGEINARGGVAYLSKGIVPYSSKGEISNLVTIEFSDTAPLDLILSVGFFLGSRIGRNFVEHLKNQRNE